jgi:hypothetical protein
MKTEPPIKSLMDLDKCSAHAHVMLYHKVGRAVYKSGYTVPIVSPFWSTRTNKTSTDNGLE